MNYSFTRYLAAKKTVDDRALNRLVWGELAQQLYQSPKPLRIIEAGAGIGTMLERMLAWGLFTQAEYTGIDAQGENIAATLQRLPAWAKANGYQVEDRGEGRLRITKLPEFTNAHFEAVDLFKFITCQAQGTWDLLVAHAFLDLLDIPIRLAQMFSLLKPGGLFYFSLNFDGLTLLEPILQAELDEQILALYHRSMDERVVDGRISGDSRAGRHLFQNLRAQGAEILEAGASDWVVFPRHGGYPGDEAYFLHHIIHFFEETLFGHPELDPQRFASWLAERHAQIERGELVFIAHQFDFVGRNVG